MVLNLKPQECVHSFQRFRIVRHDSDLPTPLCRLEGVGDRCMFLSHDGHSRRHSVMNEHGRIEVVGSEQCRNVSQVHADLVPRGVVMISHDVDFDETPIWEKSEMMNCGFLREPHRMITALVHARYTFTDPLTVVPCRTFHGCVSLRSGQP